MVSLFFLRPRDLFGMQLNNHLSLLTAWFALLDYVLPHTKWHCPIGVYFQAALQQTQTGTSPLTPAMCAAFPAGAPLRGRKETRRRTDSTRLTTLLQWVSCQEFRHVGATLKLSLLPIGDPTYKSKITPREFARTLN